MSKRKKSKLAFCLFGFDPLIIYIYIYMYIFTGLFIYIINIYRYIKICI